MSRFERHIFVCTNQREDGHPKGCCYSKGSERILELFKKELNGKGIQSTVRVNKSGCLDACEFGVTIVVYPDAVWYGGVTEKDVDEIIHEHIIGGRVVKRLLINDTKFKSAYIEFSPLKK